MSANRDINLDSKAEFGRTSHADCEAGLDRGTNLDRETNPTCDTSLNREADSDCENSPNVGVDSACHGGLDFRTDSTCNGSLNRESGSDCEIGSSRIIDLDCGISYTRIAGWLNEELALKCENEGEDGAWLFAVQERVCRIQAEPMERRKLGRVELERTRLRAAGDEEALASFEKLFTLRFISAGG